MVADSLYCKTNMAATMSRALFLETNSFNIAAIPLFLNGCSDVICIIFAYLYNSVFGGRFPVLQNQYGRHSSVLNSVENTFCMIM